MWRKYKGWEKNSTAVGSEIDDGGVDAPNKADVDSEATMAATAF